MIKHGGLISSSGDNGWYTTQETDEVIEFKYPINALLVESMAPLTLQVNGTKDTKKDEDLWYINEDDKEGIEGVTISTLMVHGSAGQSIKWKGLIA